MPAVTIRNLPDATHRAIKVRAAQHGRSAEAEMRHILEIESHIAGARPEIMGRSGGLRRRHMQDLELERRPPSEIMSRRPGA